MLRFMNFIILLIFLGALGGEILIDLWQGEEQAFCVRQ